MSWIVTGGAGYIGSHVVRALADAGLAPVVLDDLSSGIPSFVPEGVPCYTTTFPWHAELGMLSILVAVMRVYPAIDKFCK